MEHEESLADLRPRQCGPCNRYGRIWVKGCKKIVQKDLPSTNNFARYSIRNKPDYVALWPPQAFEAFAVTPVAGPFRFLLIKPINCNEKTILHAIRGSGGFFTECSQPCLKCAVRLDVRQVHLLGFLEAGSFLCCVALGDSLGELRTGLTPQGHQSKSHNLGCPMFIVQVYNIM